MSEQRRLDVPPSPQELQIQQDAIKNPTPSRATGYGIPKKFEPPKPPEKPSNLPPNVNQWLKDTEGQEQSSATH